MRVLDIECFNELSTLLGSAEAVGAAIEPGFRKNEITFAEEVERELRDIDDEWNRWFIDHKVHGEKLDAALQSEVRRLLEVHLDLLNVFDLRGQTSVFSVALCSLNKGTFVFPAKALPRQFSKLEGCLSAEGIAWIDSSRLLPKGGASR